jgi:hypothetical protein
MVEGGELGRVVDDVDATYEAVDDLGDHNEAWHAVESCDQGWLVVHDAEGCLVEGCGAPAFGDVDHQSRHAVGTDDGSTCCVDEGAAVAEQYDIGGEQRGCGGHVAVREGGDESRGHGLLLGEGTSFLASGVQSDTWTGPDGFFGTHTFGWRDPQRVKTAKKSRELPDSQWPGP